MPKAKPGWRVLSARVNYSEEAIKLPEMLPAPMANKSSPIVTGCWQAHHWCSLGAAAVLKLRGMKSDSAQPKASSVSRSPKISYGSDVLYRLYKC